MNSKKPAQTWSRFAALPAALTLAASLMGCSSISEDVKTWGLASTPAQAAEVKAAETKVTELPDIPPHLQKCIDKKAKAGKSADQKVLNEIQSADEKRACMRAILAWYKELQAAEKARGKKTASADPPKPLSP